MKNLFFEFPQGGWKVKWTLEKKMNLIDDFLKALKDLLIKVEQLAWKILSLNALESLSQSLVYIVDHLSLSRVDFGSSFLFLSNVSLITSCIFWILSMYPVFLPFEIFYSIKKQEKTY